MDIARFTRQYILDNWRAIFRKNRYDAEICEKVLRRMIQVALFPGDSAVVEDITEEFFETKRRRVQAMESECPIGWLKPSWEQAQMLNVWHPDYEPEIAPEGYQSLGIFCANRIGKTLSVIINTLLWLLPNNRDWVMFEEHVDPPLYNADGSIRRASRGTYTVFPRPEWATWRRTKRMVIPWDAESPMGPCEVWHGCENDLDWHGRIAGRAGGKDGYLAWMPRNALGMRTDGGTAIYKQERTIETRYGQQIIGKTYNADTQAWAGKAARIVNMDEGFEKDKLTEATTRVEGGGYFLWAYTPAEARNIGRRAQLAHDCYKGKLELVGRAKFFTDFTMEDAPSQVLDPDKKKADLARFAKLGGEGKSRAMGGFFESSPRVFSNFQRDKHVLPWNGSEVLAAIKGDGPDELVALFHRANIIRGMDEGTAHPTTCAWIAILRTGEYVLFREFSEAGLSVSQRCQKIIELSRNTREISHYHSEESLRRYVEKREPEGMVIRRTFADSKIFKRNPETPADEWVDTYRKQGLKLEKATNVGPEARCDYVNDMLLGDATRRHLATKESPGYRLYVTNDCETMVERLENYLHEQYSSGPNAGQFTGKPAKFGDDEIDSLCYAACSKLRWKDPSETQASPTRYDQMTGAVVR
jgi:hypothetical protein